MFQLFLLCVSILAQGLTLGATFWIIHGIVVEALGLKHYNLHWFAIFSFPMFLVIQYWLWSNASNAITSILTMAVETLQGSVVPKCVEITTLRLLYVSIVSVGQAIIPLFIAFENHHSPKLWKDFMFFSFFLVFHRYRSVRTRRGKETLLNVLQDEVSICAATERQSMQLLNLSMSVFLMMGIIIIVLCASIRYQHMSWSRYFSRFNQ